VIVKTRAGALRRECKPRRSARDSGPRCFVHHAAEINVRAISRAARFWNDAAVCDGIRAWRARRILRSLRSAPAYRPLQWPQREKLQSMFSLAHDPLDAIDGVEGCGVHFAHGIHAVALSAWAPQLHAGKDQCRHAASWRPSRKFRFEHATCTPRFASVRAAESPQKPHRRRDIDGVPQFAGRLRRRRGHGVSQ